MGVKLDRIEKEFVLNSIIENKVRIKIHGNTTEIFGQLHDYGNTTLTLVTEYGDLSALNICEKEEVRIFFFFFNKAHTFTTTIAKIINNQIVLIQPEGLYKSLQRKHERIGSPQDLKVFLSIKGEDIELNFPLVNKVVKLDKAQINEQLVSTNIKALIDDFKNKISKICSFNTIIMVRNKNLEKYEEKLIQRFAKIFWIPDTSKDYPKENMIDEEVITKSDIIQFEKENETSLKLINSITANILFQKKKEGIFSELYFPIIFQNYLIGYIHIRNTLDNPKSIGPKIIAFIKNFAQIICFSLEQNGYFNMSKLSSVKHDARIIDVSASGILFALTKEIFFKKILVHEDLKLLFLFGNRKIIINSRVIRKNNDKNNVYIAMQYIDIEPEDYRFLFEKLYGKPLTEVLDSKWEGGAPPPELILQLKWYF